MRSRCTRAALANNRGYYSTAFGVDRDRVSMLHAALGTYNSSDSPTRAALLSQLSLELLWDDDWHARERLSDDRVSDGQARRRSAHARARPHPALRSAWRPQTLPELRRDLNEAAQLADRLKDPLLAGHAAHAGAHAAIAVGGLEHADRLLTQLSAVAEQLSQPLMRWYAGVARAMLAPRRRPARRSPRAARCRC